MLVTMNASFWALDFLRIFQTYFLELTGRLLYTVGVWCSELSSKFGASIIQGLILSFKVKVVSKAVSSAV